MKLPFGLPLALSVSLCAALMITPGASARPVAAHRLLAPSRTLPIEQYRLPNGLRVVLSQDKSAPVVAVSVTYDVGSRNERPGRTGFAHLFEHLMFQGSANVGRGEHFALINDVGGTFNGTTNSDRTNYFETVPANQLPMCLFLEADRMGALDISDFNLKNQREVVKEEKRQRGGNQPYGEVQDTLLGLIYQDFAYKHTTIGSMDDLNAATLDDVRAFYKQYYAPNNAVLTVVGDFNVGEAKKQIEKYFGGLSAAPAPPPVQIAEPLHRGERRATIQDKLADRNEYIQAYLTVPGSHPDAPALNLLSAILGRGGRTSRLNRDLIETRKAGGVSASAGESRGPGTLDITVTLNQNNFDDIEKMVDSTIATLQKDGPTDDELRRAKEAVRVATILRRTSGAQGLAVSLGQAAVYFGDAERVNTQYDRYQAVTADDIKRVARQYLTSDNRAVLRVEALGAPRPGAGGGRRVAAPVLLPGDPPTKPAAPPTIPPVTPPAATEKKA